MTDETRQLETSGQNNPRPANFVDCYLGEVRLFAGNFAPRGWHFCDGTLLPVSGNDELFSLIGKRFGGDGVTTFGLPNYRGRVPIGAGLNEQNGVNYGVGQQGGSDTVLLTEDNLPPHTHEVGPVSAQYGFYASSQMATSESPIENGSLAVSVALNNASAKSNAYGVGDGSERVGMSTVTTGVKAIGQTDAAGTQITESNIMPTLPLNFIIALDGVYPSRS